MSAILLGSGVPAVMYLTWNAMVLGNVPEGSIGPHGLDLYSLLGAGACLPALVLALLGLLRVWLCVRLFEIKHCSYITTRSLQTSLPLTPLNHQAGWA
jgi:uncharacterized membrane protein YuzA (DUF378 family)